MKENLKDSKFETKIEIYSECGHAFIHNSHEENLTKKQKENVELGIKSIIEWYKKHF